MLNENVLSFAVAYGLAIQGLELSAVSTNLLPDEIVRRRLWGRKRPWFAAAGAVLLATLASPLYRAVSDRSALAQGEAYRQADRITRTLRDWSDRYDTMVRQAGPAAEPIDRYRTLFGHREFWPSFLSLLSAGIESTFNGQKLFNEYAAAEDPATRERIRSLIRSRYPVRTNRAIMIVERVQAVALPNIQGRTAAELLRSGAAAAGGGMYVSPTTPGATTEEGRPGYFIWIVGRTPLSKDSANPVLTKLRKELERASKDVPVLDIVSDYHDFSVTSRTASAGGGAMQPGMSPVRTYEDEREYSETPRYGPRRPTGPVESDPLFPNDPAEDASKDVYFQIGLIVAIEGDGITDPNAAGGP
jgi:hypothetical protein